MRPKEVCSKLHRDGEGSKFSLLETQEEDILGFEIDEERDVYARGGRYKFVYFESDDSTVVVTTFTDPKDGFSHAEAVRRGPEGKEKLGRVTRIED